MKNWSLKIPLLVFCTAVILVAFSKGLTFGTVFSTISLCLIFFIFRKFNHLRLGHVFSRRVIISDEKNNNSRVIQSVSRTGRIYELKITGFSEEARERIRQLSLKMEAERSVP